MRIGFGILLTTCSLLFAAPPVHAQPSATVPTFAQQPATVPTFAQQPATVPAFAQQHAVVLASAQQRAEASPPADARPLVHADRPADDAVPARGFLYKTLELGGQTYAYCVYVPPEYTPDKPWPVILFLHGSGERGADGFLQTDVGIGRELRRHHERIPAIVVMPQCRPGQSWLGPMAEMALTCVEKTSREYHCDPRRVYLTGLSLGGQAVWHIAAAMPDRFAAIVPICGFAELGPDTGVAPKIAARLTKMPIWAFHAADDRNVPVEKTRELVAAVRAARGESAGTPDDVAESTPGETGTTAGEKAGETGGMVFYTEYPTGGHTIWNRAYGNAQLWRWLFAQKRER